VELVSGSVRRVVAVGECMLELTRVGQTGRLGEGWRLGFGGDTFNTAWYLRRLGLPVAYFTALGSDAYSLEMRAAWQAAGMDLSLVLTDSERLPGLYAISTDASGERSFNYWRSHAAVRRLFDLPGIAAALSAAGQADVLYLSGITLSLFDAPGRARLLALAQSVRARGGVVAFDPNYRPRGWQSPGEAQATISAFAAAVSLALPTLDDEAALWGDRSAGDTAARWLHCGAEEVVIKLGAAGCTVVTRAGGESVPAVVVARVVDTTGAGDSFNAGYLAARLRGESGAAAGAAGNALAAEVIQHRGALLPRQTPMHR
jgi:2-dehydro-3-deoxygluconokinase